MAVRENTCVEHKAPMKIPALRSTVIFYITPEGGLLCGCGGSSSVHHFCVTWLEYLYIRLENKRTAVVKGLGNEKQMHLVM